MIGFLILGLGVMLFMFFGYTLLSAPFNIFMNFSIIGSFIGMIALVIYGGLWEFYFQKPAKNIIAHRGAAAWEWAIDDLGYGDLQPTKKYMPQGLVLWKFGWSLLPRPIQKFEFVQKLKERVGRKAKDPEQQKAQDQKRQVRQQQEIEFKRQEMELAERISLMKCTWKGMGKPIWFQYIGLAANFNPYVLVPGQMNQDNPHSYFDQMTEYINNLTSVSADVKKDLFQKLKDLESHIDHVRLVLDPRRFKEIHPLMYTQSQVDDHGRIHEQIGRESVSGIPMGKLLILILVIVGVLGAIAAVYYLFMKPQSPQQPAQQATALIDYIHAHL